MKIKVGEFSCVKCQVIEICLQFSFVVESPLNSGTLEVDINTEYSKLRGNDCLHVKSLNKLWQLNWGPVWDIIYVI